MESTAKKMAIESNATTEFAEERARKRKRHFDEDAEDDPIQDSRIRFKTEVYFYVLDIFVGQFENRFSDFKEMAKLFTVLNPKRFEHPDAEKKMLELARFYSEDISKPEEVVEEFHSFRKLYSELAMDLNSDAILPFLIANDMDRAYPNLAILHRIYKTIPISSASAERSFSRLKLIKSYLRSCMDEARLSNLTLLCVERDINIDKDRVVGRFATMKERRMAF
ncbi:52 kDa repressor of the inhibitor of the protein kinase-like [Notolabrus celidotus]|uniref:52 kDa repressor of the inhibitor of the protein kinase-like n=1 Tax=Notolabrus celidotus TaxID=1203425 RepID=UPI00148FE679|nr:52 kDa repressor of the inhibitor of the protein kinase-like [Notolabrus celidotus]